MSKTYFLQFGSGDPRSFTGLSPTMLIFQSAGATLAPPAITEALTGSGMYKFTWGTTTAISFLADAATTSPGANGRYVYGVLDPVDRVDEVGSTLVTIGTSLIAQGVSLFAFGTSTIAQGVSITAIGTSHLAQGVSNAAQNVSLLALGTSNLALGTSSVALGITSVAIGTTLFGYAVSLYALGLSNAIAIGSTASSIGGVSTMPSDLFGYLMRVDALLEGQESFYKGTGQLTMLDRAGSITLSIRTLTNNVSLVTKI